MIVLCITPQIKFIRLELIWRTFQKEFTTCICISATQKVIINDLVNFIRFFLIVSFKSCVSVNNLHLRPYFKIIHHHIISLKVSKVSHWHLFTQIFTDKINSNLLTLKSFDLLSPFLAFSL